MLPLLFTVTTLPLAAMATGLNINQFVKEPGILRYPIHNVEGAPALKNITKRQNDVDLMSQLTGNFYTIDLIFGTPGQVVSVNLDTGSDELWVNPVCDNSHDPAFCETFGQFTASSTWVDAGQDGHITYGTGSVDFAYGYDFVTVGGEIPSSAMANLEGPWLA